MMGETEKSNTGL